MRIRSGIPEIDRLEDECAAQAPPLVASIDDVLVDAESAQISPKTHGLARLAERPNLRRLIASGVGDSELQHFARLSLLEQLELTDPRVSDLRMLTGLSQLRLLSVSVGPSLRSLDGIEKLAKLELISTWNTPTLQSIDALARLRDLRVVFLSGGMYKPMRIPSLRPLAALDHLMRLSLSSVRVTDGSLKPLTRLTSLRRLDLPLSFPSDQFAMLERALPEAAGMWRELWRGNPAAAAKV